MRTIVMAWDMCPSGGMKEVASRLAKLGAAPLLSGIAAEDHRRFSPGSFGTAEIPH
jgi:hypothetical protein